MATKMILSFSSEFDETTLEEITAYLQEQNLPGMIIDRPEAEPVRGSMGINEYLPLIEIVAGSTVAGTTIKGLFDLVKKAMELHQESRKDQMGQGKMDFTIEKPDGAKLSLSFNARDEAERENFSAFVEQAWQK